MTEFRIGTAVLMDIQSVSIAGGQVNAGYTKLSDENVNTLKTAESYSKQHLKIKELLDIYQELIKRDVQDISDMVLETMTMDHSLAGTFRSANGR